MYIVIWLSVILMSVILMRVILMGVILMSVILISSILMNDNLISILMLSVILEIHLGVILKSQLAECLSAKCHYSKVVAPTAVKNQRCKTF